MAKIFVAFESDSYNNGARQVVRAVTFELREYAYGFRPFVLDVIEADDKERAKRAMKRQYAAAVEVKNTGEAIRLVSKEQE